MRINLHETKAANQIKVKHTLNGGNVNEAFSCLLHATKRKFKEKKREMIVTSWILSKDG